ncbi:MAG TPA: copper oxidase [Cyanobacteria bacterium UBA8803]|nr:copper oxidase [Cyanobacteria bacterium UBA9273]HBL57455.1 copper oxidase [Cyanobacteria bacterium UBA8803]
MPNRFLLEKTLLWNRRQLLKLGLAGIGVAGAGLAVQELTRERRSQALVKVPALPSNAPAVSASFNPMTIVRDFDRGTVKNENGRKIREFRLIAGTTPVQLNSAVSLVTWNFNGRVPGPTLRATAGDRIRVIFLNNGGHAHSIHFHGIHSAESDGIKPVSQGAATIYEFDAQPYGVHLYHCHIAPVTRHISKGLFGMFIVDPPQSRPPADEMVLVMGGYDLNEDNQNELYAFNGLPNYYMHHPIPIYQNQLVRLYLLNMIEFNAAATFHIHANFFRVYRTGMSLTPNEETDVITMGTAERHILEFAYPFPGKYMFHPHQDAIAEAGCMGHFEVLAPA